MRFKGFAISWGGIGIAILFTLFMVAMSYYAFEDRVENQQPITGYVVKEEATPYTSTVSVRRSEIEKIIKDSLVTALKDIEFSGGYILGYEDEYFPSKTVDFSGSLVPYYRVCGETKYPTLEEIRERLLGRFMYILNDKMSTYAKNFDGLEYSLSMFDVNIVEGKAIVSGKVYVTYKGQQIPAEYYVTVPTRFKEIYDYATNFSEMMAEYRLLDYYLLDTLLMAKEEYFPMKGVLTGCGNRIIKNRFELTAAFMDLYDYFLDNIKLNEEYREEIDKRTLKDPPYYTIPRVVVREGENKYLKRFEGLEVDIYRPDDYFYVFPSGVSLIATEPILKIVVPLGDCVLPYVINHTFPFSYVISVKDDLLAEDAYFYFAEYSFVENSAPAECSYEDVEDNKGIILPGMEMLGVDVEEGLKDAIGSDPGIEYVCEEEVLINVEVRDDKDRPIEGASVSFGPCALGETGEDGRVSGYVNKGEYVLVVDAPENYVDYRSLEDSEEKTTFIVNLPQVEEVSDIEIKYVVAQAELIKYCPEDADDCTYTPPETEGATMDVSAKNSMFGPTNAKLHLRKCVIKDEYVVDEEGTERIDVLMSLKSKLSFSDLSEKMEEISEEGGYLFDEDGVVFKTSLDIENGNTNMTPGIYYVDLVHAVEFIREGGSEEDKNIWLIGMYKFSSSDYTEFTPLEDRRSAQLHPSLLKYFNVPIVRISNIGAWAEEDIRFKYLAEKPAEALGWESIPYLDVGYVVGATKEGDISEGMESFAEELADFVYGGCGIDPFDSPSYDAYYPINNVWDVMYALEDCGLNKLEYCSEIDEKWTCDIEEVMPALESKGCKLNILSDI